MNLRDQVIYILESNRGDFVSGQSIASIANVSRNAVSKCVNALKNEGFDIESVNNLGHRLNPSSDILTASGIKAQVEDEVMVFVFDTIDSTDRKSVV